MLLVKSRELKSSGSSNLKSATKSFGCALITFVCFGLQSAFAADNQTNSITNPTSIASIFLSLLVVIGIIFALAYVMRRFNVTQAGSGQMKIVASMMAGTKERVMVVEVGSEQFLLGITAHNINHLATLSEPLKKPEVSNHSEQFKDKLIQAMAGKMSRREEPSS